MTTGLPLYDTAAARRLDARATALLGGDGHALMQRAGAAAWERVLAHWPRLGRIVVVCGPGNNGGDGYVLARLARRQGFEVAAVHLQAHAPRSELAQRARTEYVAAGGRIEWFPGEGAAVLAQAELIVDALFGIGLSRAPDADSAALIEAVNACGQPVFSLDVPSGVDADRGAVPGAAVRADRTLQFIVRHFGSYTGDALDCVGEVELDALDVPQAAFEAVGPVAELLEADWLAARLPPRRRNTHKGESGRVLCIGGDHGAGGAVVLCAEAALRCGAGLLSAITRAAHVPALLARRPEAMAHAPESTGAAAPLLAAADAVALGPGLGQGEWGRAWFDAVLGAGKPTVFDADALNLLAAVGAAASCPSDAVLTPHPGEAARLLGTDAAAVQADRYAAAEALAQRHGCPVVLKGAGSLVAAPGRRVRVVGAGNPGMAVGGMGDVLTGVIAALRAQGLDAFEAASAGVLLHALAGDAAATTGARGLLPSDLFPHLRRLANP